APAPAPAASPARLPGAAGRDGPARTARGRCRAGATPGVRAGARAPDAAALPGGRTAPLGSGPDGRAAGVACGPRRGPAAPGDRSAGARTDRGRPGDGWWPP